MIDENSPINTLSERTQKESHKNMGDSASKSPSRSKRNSLGKADKDAPLQTITSTNKKRAPEQSPQKSESKRSSLRKSPLSIANNKDTVKNRRETVDPAELDGILDDLSESSLMHNESMIHDKVMNGKSKENSVPSRRSSRLSDTSKMSDLSSLDGMSPLPPNRRTTVNAADIDALLNDSTTSEQMRQMTSASPSQSAKLDSTDIALTTREYQLNSAVPTEAILQLDPAAYIHHVDDEVQLNLSGSAIVDTSFDDRRTTIDAADMQALLDDDTGDFTTTNIRRSSIASTTSARGGARRLTIDAAQIDALLEDIEEENAKEVSHSSICSTTNRLHTEEQTQSICVQESSHPAVVEVPAQTCLQHALTHDEHAVSDIHSAAPVSTLSFHVEPSAAAKARRASMASSIVTRHMPVRSAPRRMTADLADLKGLAEELSKQQEQLEHSKHGHISSESVNEMETAPTIAAAVEMETTVNSADSAADAQEDQDSIMSLGALISRRGTLETSFNSSHAPDSRRESRLSMLSVNGGFTTTLVGPSSPARSPVQPPSVLKSGLKSCLSSKKSKAGSRLSIGGKSVIFGSPKAVEFTRGAPTDALTPMERSTAKSLFSMVGSAPRTQDEIEAEEQEDENTRENTSILEEWDRLTTSNGDGSDEEVDEFPLPPTPVLPESPSTNSQRSPRRRLSGRMPALDLEPMQTEESEQSSMVMCVQSEQNKFDTEDLDLSSSHISEATGTVNLPADFAELIAQNEVDVLGAQSLSRGDAFIALHRQSLDTSTLSLASEDSKTMPLERDLQGVLRHVDYIDTGVLDTSIHSTSSAQTSASESSGHSLGGVLGLSVPTSTAVLSARVTETATPAGTAYKMSIPLSNENEMPFQRSNRTSMIPGAFSVDASPVHPASASDRYSRQMLPMSPMMPICATDFSTIQKEKVHVAPSSVTIAKPTIEMKTTPAIATRLMPSSADQNIPNNAASSILSRLRNLNDGSRRLTLSQSAAIGTPGASRMSTELKRAALVNSVTKAASEAKRLQIDVMGLNRTTDLDSSTLHALHYEDAEVTIMNMRAEGAVDDSADLDLSADTVQEELIPAPLSLDEVLSSAGLASNVDFTCNSAQYGVLAALQSLQKQVTSPVLAQVSEVLFEKVEEAARQATEIPADKIRLQETWSNASSEVHAHVRSLLQKPTMYSGSPGPAGAPENKLISLAKQCKQIVVKRWSNWEDEILQAGSTAVASLSKELRKKIEQCQAETLALRRKAASLTAAPATALAQEVLQKQLLAIQQRIKDTRQQIEDKRTEVEMLSEERSVLLEKRKQALVAFARDNSHIAGNEKQKLQRAEERQKELNEEWAGLAETQRLVSVMNRLSTYRTTSYRPNNIVVEVPITSKVRSQVSFTLASGSIGLEVQDVAVELMQFGAVEAGDSESEFAHAYFRDYMASNKAYGPLSEAALAQIDTPREIPPLLQRISGHVLAVRRALAALDAFATDGYSWALHGSNIVATFPGDKYKLVLPMSQILAGGVMQITPQALCSTATGDSVAEYPMKAVISSLRMRFGAKERGHFQSFPARAVRKEVEAIVKHI